MTSTAPWRRMILHFSHIGLTDGRTFMSPFVRREEARAGRVDNPAAGATTECSERRSAGRLVPRRQHPWAICGYGDRELEVRGERSVGGVDRPMVVCEAHVVAPGRDHRLDGEH